METLQNRQCFPSLIVSVLVRRTVYKYSPSRSRENISTSINPYLNFHHTQSFSSDTIISNNMTSGARTLENSPSSDVAQSSGAAQLAFQQPKYLAELQADLQASMATLQQKIDCFRNDRRQITRVNNHLLTLGVNPSESFGSYASSILSSPTFAGSAIETSFPTIVVPPGVLITQLYSPGFFAHTPDRRPLTVPFRSLFPVLFPGPAWTEMSFNDLESDNHGLFPIFFPDPAWTETSFDDLESGDLGLGSLGRISPIEKESEEESSDLGFGRLCSTEEGRLAIIEEDQMEDQMDEGE